MNRAACPPAAAPAPLPAVLPHDRKRSLASAPVEIRNGEPAPKLARSQAWEGAGADAELQAIERLQELLHRRAPFETLLAVACRSETLLNGLNPTARALLAELQAGASLGPAQYEAVSAGLKAAMQRSGLFEPVG